MNKKMTIESISFKDKYRLVPKVSKNDSIKVIRDNPSHPKYKEVLLKDLAKIELYKKYREAAKKDGPIVTPKNYKQIFTDKNLNSKMTIPTFLADHTEFFELCKKQFGFIIAAEFKPQRYNEMSEENSRMCLHVDKFQEQFGINSYSQMFRLKPKKRFLKLRNHGSWTYILLIRHFCKRKKEIVSWIIKIGETGNIIEFLNNGEVSDNSGRAGTYCKMSDATFKRRTEINFRSFTTPFMNGEYGLFPASGFPPRVYMWACPEPVTDVLKETINGPKIYSAKIHKEREKDLQKMFADLYGHLPILNFNKFA